MEKVHVFLFTLLALMLGSCTDVDDVQPLYPEYKEVKQLTMVDKNATLETKALYANLWMIQAKGFMFGHHDDLWYGRKWYDESGRSDTKDVCGDYPAVFSFDVAEMMDDRYQSGANKIRRRVAIEAYDRGEVLIACMHLNNPKTGGDSWDNSDKEVVKEILQEGSATNVKFKVWLDRLAEFALGLKGSDGKQIPVILRPFHEHTQGWSWWGSSCTSQEEFISLWKFTVTYLRDLKDVHNFIYAISPQIDATAGRDKFLFRWPGNDYVDFLGMDAYHGLNPNIFTANLFLLSKLSKELNKPCGVTETGVEGIQRDGVPEKSYWTQQILTPASEQFISMVVMWRNAYDPSGGGSHFYSAFKGHASEKDFIRMYKSPVSIFSKDLPAMYRMPERMLVN